MSTEFWKAVFDWGTVVLIGLTFVFGAGALITGKILSDFRETRLRQFDKDLTRAKAELGQQQERAAIADAKVSGLEKDASNAKTEMAKQQTRAATAERSLLELKEQIKPRHLTDKKAEAFVAALKTLPGGTIDFGYTSAGGDECFNFAKEFLRLFKQANWEVRNRSSISNHLDVQVIGVGIFISVPAGPDPTMPPSGHIELTPTMKTLQAAFRAVGIEPQFISWFPGKTAPEVIIGSKPEPNPLTPNPN